MRFCDNCNRFVFLNSTVIFSKFVNHLRYAFLFPFFCNKKCFGFRFYMHIFSNVYETTSNRTLFSIWNIMDYKYFIMYSYIVPVVLFNIFRYLLNVHKYWWIIFYSADVGTAQSSVSTNVIVSANGNVTWLSMWIFKSSCSMDVRYFPFDVQNCSMNFASWTFDAYRVDIRNFAKDGDLSNYVNSSEFEIVEFSFERHVVVFTCCPEPYVFMTYTLVFQRKPLFYLFNMVMPCILITLVALLGFYMPNDSGEKLSMGITTLLSMTVFLMIVAERLPPVSDNVPLIGIPNVYLLKLEIKDTIKYQHVQKT